MTKPWSEMEPRERDALVAEKIFNLTLNYEFAEELGAPSVPALRDQYDEWGILPEYTTDHTAVRLVEDEIERRGIDARYLYIKHLILIFNPDPEDFVLTWDLLRATPEQRCLAALRACGVEV